MQVFLWLTGIKFNFGLFIDFEQPNVYWVHIEKKKSHEDKIEYFMRYVLVF